MSPNEQIQPEGASSRQTHLNKKYRPQSFDASELVGQEHIVRTLKNAVRADRIAPAYLFCGPRGTGKTSTARILAKAANCLDPDPDRRPCNVCISCNAINQNATPDVIEIDAASNRGIDDIRDLREKVRYAPTQLRLKFYIIDEAHQITGAAANAFLKTLEEPPDSTRFILATTDPEELLPTIVSRCQRFDFRRHSPDVIAARIKSLAEREGIILADDALTLITELAHGSMRDPIGLLEQLANFQPGGVSDASAITADDIRELVGITRSELAERILRAISLNEAGTALAAINEAVLAGQDPRQLNRQIVAVVRDGLFVTSGVRKAEDLELAGAYERLGLAGLLRTARAFADTDVNIRSAVIPQLPIEMAVLAAIMDQDAARNSTGDVPGVRAKDLAPATARPQHAAPINGNSRPAPEPVAEQENPAPPANRLANRVRQSDRTNPIAEPIDIVDSPSPGDITVELLVNLWPKIRADVKSLDRRTEALLGEIDPVDMLDGQIVLAASYEFHRDKVNEEERRSTLESVISRRLGKTISLQCVLRSEFSQRIRAEQGPESAVDQVPMRATEPTTKVDAQSDDEKLLGAVMRIFNGEVIDDGQDID